MAKKRKVFDSTSESESDVLQCSSPITVPKQKKNMAVKVSTQAKNTDKKSLSDSSTPSEDEKTDTPVIVSSSSQNFTIPDEFVTDSEQRLSDVIAPPNEFALDTPKNTKIKPPVGFSSDERPKKNKKKTNQSFKIKRKMRLPCDSDLADLKNFTSKN